MDSTKLAACRYRGDAEQFAALRNHPRLGMRIEEAKPTLFRNSIRTQLLQSAVRVDSRLLPKIADSLRRLRAIAGLSDEIEMYVFEASAINAFVTRGRSHLFVALSSGAINTLSEHELEFVIGHELGHAIFEHVDFGIGQLLEAPDVEPRDRMQMFAWKRSSEISADRAGLVCCGSLDVAATAMFKTLSGLNIPGLKIDVAAFAEQWDHLLAEVVRCGDSDGHWQITHPFPPLRMKAMQIFWQSEYFKDQDVGPSAARASQSSVDGETAKLLAMMDPLARGDGATGDPLLADFLLWGGLHIAVSNGAVTPNEEHRLSAIVAPGLVRSAVSQGPTPDGTLRSFGQFLERRQLKLKALEIHRIMEGLLHIAHADGVMDEHESQALSTLAQKLGIPPNAVAMLVSKYQTER